jgi:hypothetical protein
LLARLLRLLLRLITLLQQKNATLSRLKRLLFGPRSDKRGVASPSSGAESEVDCGFFRTKVRADRFIRSFFNLPGSSFKIRPTSEVG